MVIVDESHCHKKMFFTTSDIVGQMNSAMGCGGGAATSNESKNDDEEVRGFELHTRMPDGSYRPTQSNELAAVDFQSKMKQAAESIVGLDRRQKLEWASRQRRMGNELFAAGEYREAMDVYLTCLVVVERGGKGASSSLLDDDGNNSIFDQMEEEIQLPVLLNLALSAMKMGMPGKAEKFCNHAIDETSCGKLSPKAYFRRGRVRLLMGHYVDAASDLDAALGLLQRLYDDFEEENHPIVSSVQNGEMTTTPFDTTAKTMVDIENERIVILREKERLNLLVRQAERTEKVQKRAMERLFGGLSSNQNDEGDPSVQSSLYPEKEGLSRGHTQNIDVRNKSTSNHKIKDECQPQLTYFRWYMCMIGRCAQKLLELIGEAEEEENDDDSMVYLANTCSFKGGKDA